MNLRRSVVAAMGVAAVLVTLSALFGQPRLPARSPWKALPLMPLEAEQAAPGVRPDKFAAFQLDRKVLADLLSRAPLEGTPAAARPLDIPIPMPDGTVAIFKTVEAPIMHPDLQARYPQIRTYLAWKDGDKATTSRFDLTPLGFHAQIITPGGFIYVDPYTALDATGHYASYWLSDWRAHDWLCGVPQDAQPLPDPPAAPAAEATGTVLRTYRAAIAANGEFTALYGGTVASGLAAVVTATNRTTAIFEVECAVRLQLVANNDLLIYTDSATDPYTNSSGSTMLAQNQAAVDSVIGFANYDIGHVYTRAGDVGGIAQLGVVGVNGNKARGVSGNFNAAGDPASTLTVAHEMGHQFNAGHSFNGINGGCSGNGSGATQAFEPGSGSTVMSYGGLCGVDNIVSSRDAYYSSGSYDRIAAWAAGGSGVFQSTPTGNLAPLVDAGPNFVIPARTPFVLTAASASDPDGDAITYCWEQRNGGSGFALSAGDPGNGPIIRSRPATTSSSRTIPALTNLLQGEFALGEILPTTTRSMVFRCTVRDNRAGGGGVNTDEMGVTSINTGSPFRVIFPSVVSGSLSGTQVVTWNVAGTTANGINTANVRILLSTDGGSTWPTTLLASTPNNGSAVVVLPQITTSSARVRVEAVGNIFFDVSDANFSIAPAPAGISLALGGVVGVGDASGTGNANGVAEPGEHPITLAVPLINKGLTTATVVSATLTSLTATASVIDNFSTYPDLANGFPANNTALYSIALASNHPCGTPVSLRLNLSTTQGAAVVNFTLPVGTPGTISYTTPAVAIPDNNASGAIVPLTVAGVPGTISDVNFRFGGTSCSTTSTSTTVGLNHSYIGELVVSLVSPSGTSVKLIQFMANGNADNSGNNFCQTLLDDQGGGPSIQTQTNAAAPFTGTFSPANPLSAFNGQTANGTWHLNVKDLGAGDTGSVRAFSLTFNNNATTTCQPPATIPPCSAADVATEGLADPLAGPDGFITGIDFDVFVQAYFTDLRNASNQLIADITDGTGLGGPDGFNTGTDFDKFVQLYYQGCP